MFQVRTIVTETAFSIDELEELYVLFKVSYSFHIRVVGLTGPSYIIRVPPAPT